MALSQLNKLLFIRVIIYPVICSMCSESEDKARDILTGNHIINIKIHTTNIDIFLVLGSYEKEEALYIRREELKDKENLILYVVGL